MRLCVRARNVFFFFNVSFDGCWLLLAMDRFCCCRCRCYYCFWFLHWTHICLYYVSFFIIIIEPQRCAMSKEIHDMKTIMDLNRNKKQNNNNGKKKFIIYFNYQSHCLNGCVRVCVSASMHIQTFTNRIDQAPQQTHNESKIKKQWMDTQLPLYICIQSVICIYFSMLCHTVICFYLFIYLCGWVFFFLLLTLSFYHFFTSFWTLLA